METRYGARAGARQYIRILQLMDDHPLQRVQDAVEEPLVHPPPDADRIRMRVAFHATADAARAAANPATPAGSTPEPPLNQYHVPPPDLNRFDRLLSQGDEADDDVCEHPTVAQK